MFRMSSSDTLFIQVMMGEIGMHTHNIWSYKPEGKLVNLYEKAEAGETGRAVYV